MANLQRILRRQPVVDEAEFEAVRSRVLVRLAAMNRAGEVGEDGSRPDGAVEGGASSAADGSAIRDASPPTDDRPRPDGPIEPRTAAPDPSIGVPVMVESASTRPAVPVMASRTTDPVPTGGPDDVGVDATNQGGRRKLVSFARPANIAVHARVSGPATAPDTAPLAAAVALTSPVQQPARRNGTRGSVAAARAHRTPDPKPGSVAAVPPMAAADASAPVAKDRPVKSRRRTKAASESVPVSEVRALVAVDPSGQALLFATDEDPVPPSVEVRSARLLEESVILAGPPAELSAEAELTTPVEARAEPLSTPDEPPAEAEPPVAVETTTSVEAYAEASAVAPAATAAAAASPPAVVGHAGGGPRPVRPAASRPSPPAARRSPPAARRSPGEPRAVATTVPRHLDPVDIAAYCPYCATPLDPPPDATRRCLRCHQKIVVRKVGPRTVYLVEAALPVFEAERRRAAEGERWRNERERWLDLARKAGAPADRVTRAGREPLSEAAAAAARTLYLSTVDSAFRAAKGERRWEDAARIRIDQALLLHRIAGTPATPPDEALRYHREGLAAMLNGIGEVARDAELRSAGCCQRCQAEHGSSVRVAQELRTPRLPHPGCPKGLCRCRWTMSARDQEFLAEFLRRQARLNRRQRPSSTED